MPQSARTTVLELAADQHGLFSSHQARSSGLPVAAVRHWEDAGLTERVASGVWRVAGSPRTPEQRAMAAVLAGGPGTALCRSSAGWLWGIPGHGLEPVQVMRTRGDRSLPGGATHTSRLVDDADLTTRRGIPTTTPARTLFDLAGRQHPGRTRRDLNHLCTRGLLGSDALCAQLHRLARRGRPGIRIMRGLIDELLVAGAPAGSSLELRAEQILQDCGLGAIERQVELGDDDGVIGRVDFADRRLRVVVEVDSDRFHGGLVDRELDEARNRRLARAGWTVIRIDERELWWGREELEERLRSAVWSTHDRSGRHSLGQDSTNVCQNATTGGRGDAGAGVQ